MRRHRAAFTLVEAVVALAIVAIGVVAAEQLLAQSVRASAAERAATQAQLVAQALLTEARQGPVPLGRIAGTDPAGVRFERDVLPTDHPALREVRVRTESADGPGAGCTLVEVLRVPLLP
jgi:type II secretory pathway pseudopilin PulG